MSAAQVTCLLPFLLLLLLLPQREPPDYGDWSI